MHLKTFRCQSVCALGEGAEAEEFEVAVKGEDFFGFQFFADCHGDAVNKGDIFLDFWIEEKCETGLKTFMRDWKDGVIG